MFRIGWEKATATLVAQNKVKSYWAPRDGGPSIKVQIWDYMVELPGTDGEPTRLVIRVKGGATLELPGLGSAVPVLVNRKRTKAAFDRDDPSISPDARRERGKAIQKANEAAKRAKFEAKLRERSRPDHPAATLSFSRPARRAALAGPSPRACGRRC